MRKKELIEQQYKTIESIFDIFKVLVEGGTLSVHFYKDKQPAYFIHTKNSEKCDAVFSRKIYQGLLSRGLIVWDHDVVCEDFVAQEYVLRNQKEKSSKE